MSHWVEIEADGDDDIDDNDKLLDGAYISFRQVHTAK